jgi:hypothetical protein
MLDILYQAERVLPALLTDDTGWNSIFIDYEDPYVERLWRTWGEYRINLHCILPCSTGHALFHPHPWPSAMRIVEHQYEMTVGYGVGDQEPPVAMRLVLPPGSVYEMTNPDGWHAVRPVSLSVLTLMITGKPWSRSSPKSTKPLGPLSVDRNREMLSQFMRYYPAR